MKKMAQMILLLAVVIAASCSGSIRKPPTFEDIFIENDRILSTSFMEEQEKRFFEKLGAYAKCKAMKGQIGKFTYCAPELRDSDDF